MICGDKKKKHWVDFYHYRLVVYTHLQHHIKVNFASDFPFKETLILCLTESVF